MAKYSEKLKNPLWQRKRLEVLTRDNFKCQMCGSKDDTIHIHHRHYMAGREPWEYPDGLLVTLCHNCHRKEEDCVTDAEDILKTMHYWGYFNTEIIAEMNRLINLKISVPDATENTKRLD